MTGRAQIDSRMYWYSECASEILVQDSNGLHQKPVLAGTEHKANLLHVGKWNKGDTQRAPFTTENKSCKLAAGAEKFSMVYSAMFNERNRIRCVTYIRRTLNRCHISTWRFHDVRNVCVHGKVQLKAEMGPAIFHTV